MKELQLQILKLEFYQYNVDTSETISMKDFAKAAVSYVSDADKLEIFIKRIDDLPDYNVRPASAFQSFESNASSYFILTLGLF